MSKLSVNVHEGVENEARYVSVVQARIKGRATAAKLRAFRETADGARAYDFLMQTGEFSRTIGGTPVEQMDEQDFDYAYDRGLRVVTHPVVKASLGDFFAKMVKSLDDWGQLTEGQLRAVLGMIKKAEDRLAGYKAERVAAAANCVHVGVVGKREVFTLTLDRLVSLDGVYGTSYIHICHDDAGNKVVYKGTNLLTNEKGARFTVKATVKEHGERDGIKQTMISRPAEFCRV